MRAMAMHAFGGPEVLRLTDLPRAVAGPGEVVLQVATVCANRQDLYTLAGRAHNQGADLPHIPGNDPAGIIVEVGDGVDPARVGERAVVKPSIACGECARCRADDESACERLTSIGLHRPGGFAEYVAVPASNAFRIPDAVDFAAASALSQSGPVALNMLRNRTTVRADDTVLVSGAAGGIGSAVVQIARAAGATVIALVSDPERGAIARASGAHDVIDYGADPDIASAVRSLVPRGVTLYVETAGSPPVWESALKAMARTGRIVVCGSHAGPIVPLDLNWLFRNRLTILGASGSTRSTFAEALSMAGDGTLTPQVDSVWPWTEAASAFARLLAHENHGKVVLQVVEPSSPSTSE